MQNIIIYSRHPKDEPVLQYIENYLQHLSHDVKAAIAIAAEYEVTEPQTVYFDYMCNRHPKLNKSITLLQELSPSGLFALTRAILEKLAVLEQLQGAAK